MILNFYRRFLDKHDSTHSHHDCNFVGHTFRTYENYSQRSGIQNTIKQTYKLHKKIIRVNWGTANNYFEKMQIGHLSKRADDD